MAEHQTQELIYGIHPIQQALDRGERRCYKIAVEKSGNNPKLSPLLAQARNKGIRLEFLPREVFRKKFSGAVHQGVVGYFSPKETLTLEDLVRQAFEASALPAVVLLDGIQDPQNLGAIIRSAYVLGMQGLVIPRHRAAPLTETVAKCSAGALEHLPIAVVTNLARAIEYMKEQRFWIVGADMQGERPCHEFDFNLPVALVVGGEGIGIRRLVRQSCDFTVHIPMAGSLGSLNAASASTILFYEILRQRLTKPQD